MPVTELAFFQTRSGTVDPEFRALAADAIAVQDLWCDANLPSMPKGPEARGVGMFQQLPPSGSSSSTAAAALLLTAHWASTAQHGEWIASPPNQAVFPRLCAQLAAGPGAVEFFHVDGVEAFTCTSTSTSTSSSGGNTEDVAAAAAAGPPPVLGAPVVSVARYQVAAAGGREAFEAAWDGARARLNARAAPHVHVGGWRIEKPAREEGEGEGEGEEEREEYVVIGGWESAEKAERFFLSSDPDAAEEQDRKEFEEAIGKVASGRDVRLYKRFL